MVSRAKYGSDAGTNGNITLAKLFEFIENNEAKNELAHNEIKVEIQKNRQEVLEKMSDVKERLIKIESQPAHENFQQKFCPNTQDIRDVVKWVERHENEVTKIFDKLAATDKKIDKFIEVIESEREKYDVKVLRDQLEGTRRMKIAIIGMILTSVGSILTAAITHVLGLW